MSVGQTNPLRQQMINMMYLVLMALLALNVSADILKAFALVNGSLQKTNVSYKDRNDLTMAQFQKLYNDDPARAKIVYTNAQKIRDIGDNTYAYLQTLKDTFAAMSDGWADEAHTKVINDQDLEVGTNFMVNKKHAVELRKHMSDFQSQIRALLTDANGTPTPNAINIDASTLQDPPKDKDGTRKTWAEYYFEGVPSIAAVTEVTKFQNEVRNTVGEAIQYLIKQVGANTLKFDALIPVISSPTPAVYSGDKYEANISIGAISNTQQFEATVNGTPVPVQNGVAHFETGTSGIGEKTLNIDIKYKDPQGEWKTMTTTTKYNVFTGSATISATKMNMLYIGLQNPISVSVPGFRPDQIQVTATSGLNLKTVKQGSDYTVNPVQGVKDATITVSADGHRVGSMQFRVRPIPKPEVLFGTRTGGGMSRGELMTVQYINAGLGAGFAFEGIGYKVLAYTLIYAPKHGQVQPFQVQGNTIPGNLKAIMNSAHTGDMVIVTEVRAQGPGGTVTIPGPTITIQ